ncbi:MAG: acylphosphatase [Candidatus Omnitrophota bacterium]
MEEAEQAHVYFTGRVQGVGFRFTARFLAQRYAIKGWVRNLPDGRVELLAQSQTKKVIQFLDNLRGDFKGYITNEETQWRKADNDLDEFRVQYF